MLDFRLCFFLASPASLRCFSVLAAVVGRVVSFNEEERWGGGGGGGWFGVQQSIKILASERSISLVLQDETNLSFWSFASPGSDRSLE